MKYVNHQVTYNWEQFLYQKNVEEKTLLCGYVVQFQHEVGEKYFHC